MSTPETPQSADLSSEQRQRLRRAHERLRTASKDVQALVATEPIKGRHGPESAPAEIMEAARAELREAGEALAEAHGEILGW